MKIDRKKPVLAMMDRNHTTVQLAEEAGLSRGTISSIKCGKSCSVDTIKRISKALGVEPKDTIE